MAQSWVGKESDKCDQNTLYEFLQELSNNNKNLDSWNIEEHPNRSNIFVLQPHHEHLESIMRNIYKLRKVIVTGKGNS